VNTPSSPVASLVAVACDFGVIVSSVVSPTQAAISVPRAAGDRYEFALELLATGDAVSVREQLPLRLPVFCPDRHINEGGWFCLGWDSTAVPEVVDEKSARAWWTAVVRFLQLQLAANELGVWVNQSNDWAHGNAAIHQELAEAAAKILGARFRDDLRAARFLVTRKLHTRGARLELRRDGRLTARVAVGPPDRLMDRRVVCPCDESAGVPVDACRDHSDQLIRFTVALWRWKEAEAQFLRELARRGAVCCGTLKKCKLRDAIAREKASTLTSDRHARRHKSRRRPRL